MLELKNRKVVKLQQDKQDISDQISLINKKIIIVENELHRLREKRADYETRERYIAGELHHLRVGDGY